MTFTQSSDPVTFPHRGRRPRNEVSVDSSIYVTQWIYLEKWLLELQYKPGWIFTLMVDREASLPKLGIFYWALDSTAWRHTPPGRPVTANPAKVGRTWLMGAYATHSAKDFGRFVRHCILELEAHEVDEWLQDLDGIPLHDPHTPKETP